MTLSQTPNAIRQRQWRVANPERARARGRKASGKWRQKNPQLVLASNRRQRKLPAPTRPCPDVCECCGQPPGKKALAIDHDHITGAFRGWLCVRCNTAIGKLGDTVAGLQRAINYLTR